jgi:hypothetical protein
LGEELQLHPHQEAFSEEPSLLPTPHPRFSVERLLPQPSQKQEAYLGAPLRLLGADYLEIHQLLSLQEDFLELHQHLESQLSLCSLRTSRMFTFTFSSKTQASSIT